MPHLGKKNVKEDGKMFQNSFSPTVPTHPLTTRALHCWERPSGSWTPGAPQALALGQRYDEAAYQKPQEYLHLLAKDSLPAQPLYIQDGEIQAALSKAVMILPERLLHDLGPEDFLLVQVHGAVAVPHLGWPWVGGKIFGFT